MFELLETRSLLAVTLDPTTGILTVDGTSGPDRIGIRRQDANIVVVVNGTPSSFPADSVNGIVVNAMEGNDFVSLLSPATTGGGGGGVNKPATLNGGDGNDQLTGGVAGDVLDGGLGNDRLDGAMGADVMIGGDGIDTADYSHRMQAVNVTLDDNADDGQIATATTPAEGDNVGSDVENVLGGAGNDTIVGSPFRNNLNGGPGNDDINGAGGNDSLLGMAGDDALFGGPGNDVMDGGLGADTFGGGDGIDLVSYQQRHEDLVLSIDGNANDGAAGEGDNIHLDVENLASGSGNDMIAGSPLANNLNGGAGDDVIHGLAGNDTITGGPGMDTCFGDEGDDFFNLRDGAVDHADGGTGTNHANADAIDVLVNIDTTPVV